MFDLLYAAAIGDLPSVRHCVLRSKKSSFLWGDLTRTCCRGRAAIQYAVLGGHADVTAELIEAGTTGSMDDYTPLRFRSHLLTFSAAFLGFDTSSHIFLCQVHRWTGRTKMGSPA